MARQVEVCQWRFEEALMTAEDLKEVKMSFYGSKLLKTDSKVLKQHSNFSKGLEKSLKIIEKPFRSCSESLNDLQHCQNT